MTILENLGLSADAKAARRLRIGGSDANVIMGEDAERIHNLWLEKRGERMADDLSDVLPVMLGSFTEPFNVAWFEKRTGRTVTCQGDVRLHGAYMAATLDGMTDGETAVFEAKHVGSMRKDDDIFAAYVPQLTHNCVVTGTTRAVLSVLKGNADWCLFEYELDHAYADALVEAEARFWDCVRTGTPPVDLPPAVEKPKPVGVKEYDMRGHNEWAVHAGGFLDTITAHGQHEAAKKALKGLVPDDASKCAGHGVIITRTKAGALRFSTED